MPTAPNFPFTPLYIGAGRRFRSLRVISHPAVEPVTLAELRAHCAIDIEDHDPMLAGFIAAAREWAERYCDRHFIDTRLEMTLDNFPADVEIKLPRGSFSPTAGRQQIELSYFDANLISQSLTEAAPNLVSSGNQFLANRASIPPVITPNILGYWPVVGPLRSAVYIRWWAGFGSSPSEVPRAVRHAILMIAAHYFLNREAAAATELIPVPYGAMHLLAMYKAGGYA